MADLEVLLLGPPVVEARGARVGFDTRKAVAVLARLVLEGPQRRETLAALLWPESDTAHARSALRRTLSVMKSHIGDDALAIGREQVRLEPGAFECDVHTFRDRVQRVRTHHGRAPELCGACVDELTEALALHRESFLAGFGLRDSPDFDDWQFSQSEMLRAELATTLDLLVDARVHRGELVDAGELARRRLAIDPLHEPTHRRLMLLQAWTGHREDAIRQFRDCVTTLGNELGVPPLEETTSLYQAIVADRLPPLPVEALQTEEPRPDDGPGLDTRPTPAFDAPVKPPMVGRHDELDRLTGIRGSIRSHGRLVIVEGEAGIGKTRLLDEFTTRVMRAGGAVMSIRCYLGEERLAYAPIADALRAATMGNGRPSVARAWLSEISRLVPELLEQDPALSPPAPLGSPEADRRFVEGIRQTLIGSGAPGQPATVVIEDVHWADTASQELIAYLAHRLHDAPLCLLLSWRSELVGRDHPLRRLTSVPRQGTDTEHLVLDRLTPEEVNELARLVGLGERGVGERLFQETEGLPLVAAGQLQMLASGHQSDEEWAVPPSVRDLLQQRLAGLSETARQVLTAAAVIGRSFDLRTLLQVSGRTEHETVEGLEELLASDVVTEVDSDPSRGGARYDFRHHTFRSVVYEEVSIARRRLLHGRTADSLRRRGRVTDGAVPLAVLAEHLRLAGRERDAAHAFVRAGDESAALSSHDDAVEHYRAAIALGHPDVVRVHESIGDMLTLSGAYADALTNYQTAAGRSVEPEQLAGIEHKIASIHQRRGDWSAAKAHLEAAVAALPPTGAQGVRSHLEAELSLTAHRRGHPGDARRQAEHSLRLANECDDALAAAQAHNILGIIARTAGEPDRAVAHLERSLEGAEASLDAAPRIAALNNLALAYGDRGDLPAALELAKTALAGCRAQGDLHREAAILNNLADLLRAAGQHEEAMRHLKGAVTIFADIGEPEHPDPEIWKLVDW